MKKFILFLAILVILVYIFYTKIYEPGKFNTFLERYPDSITAQMIEYYLGITLSMLGKSDSAIFRFQRVINNYNLEKLKSASYYHIAQIYEDKKDMSQAIKFYKLAAQKYPNDYYGDLAKKRYEYLLLLGYKE